LTQYIPFFISEPPNNFSTTNSRLVVPPPSSTATKAARLPQRLAVGGDCGLVIECSSHPQNKATKHYMKTLPHKRRPSNIRRGPTVYPPLPSLPAEWSFFFEYAAAEACPV
ncbi:50S ribosomal protein 6 chloroplastic, partial [Phtheirospermum japonicum]